VFPESGSILVQRLKLDQGDCSTAIGRLSSPRGFSYSPNRFRAKVVGAQSFLNLLGFGRDQGRGQTAGHFSCAAGRKINSVSWPILVQDGKTSFF
jgi:hypothetical protein